MEDDRPAPLIEVKPDPETLATAVAGELLNRIADAQAAGHVPHIGLTGGTIADAVHRRGRPDGRGRPGSTGARCTSGSATSDSCPPTPPTATPARRAERSSTRSARAGSTRCRRPTRCRTRRPPRRRTQTSCGPRARAPSTSSCSASVPTVTSPRSSPATPPSTSPMPSRSRCTTPPSRRPTGSPSRSRPSTESHAVWFLVSGEAKADAVARTLADDGSVAETPARGVRGLVETTFFLDHEAASRL